MSMELLPESLIHRIQSFLTGRKAAQTAIVSKSWRSAWSTRPTIDLDEANFQPVRNHNHRAIDELTEFANKTFPRYEESNLSIDTFILCATNISYARFGFAAKWTLEALKLGATDLTFRFPNQNINIPIGQVFESKNVQRLCLQGLEIDQLKLIRCTGLKSLTLSDLTIKTDQFLDILSCFPLIEYLSLSNIITTSNDPLVVTRLSHRKIILPKLMSLVLSRFQSRLHMKTMFLDNFSSRFPNIKHLTLEFIVTTVQSDSRHHFVPNFNQTQLIPNYYNQAEVIPNVSSATLETLNIRYVDVNIGKRKTRDAGFDLDVPNIRKFTFEGPCMPELCIISPSLGDKCVSDVTISNHGDLSSKWFYELSEFLTKLKGSKIHLCLHLHSSKGYDYEAGKVDGLNVCEVDDLTLDTKDVPSLSLYGFLDALFRSCHPKMITQYISRGDDGANTRYNDLLLCRSLELGMQTKSVLLPTHFMYGLRDLEELEAQQLSDGVWEPQALGSISEQRRFRVRLKWKPSPDQYMRCPGDDVDDDELDVAYDEYGYNYYNENDYSETSYIFDVDQSRVRNNEVFDVDQSRVKFM